MGGVREREKGERHGLTVCVYVHEFDKSYTRAELAEEEPERNTVKTFCVDLEINHTADIPVKTYRDISINNGETERTFSTHIVPNGIRNRWA